MPRQAGFRSCRDRPDGDRPGDTAEQAEAGNRYQSQTPTLRSQDPLSGTIVCRVPAQVPGPLDPPVFVGGAVGRAAKSRGQGCTWFGDGTGDFGGSQLRRAAAARCTGRSEEFAFPRPRHQLEINQSSDAEARSLFRGGTTAIMRSWSSKRPNSIGKACRSDCRSLPSFKERER